MSERIEFPTEPIRVDAGERVTPRERTPGEIAEEDAVFAKWDELEHDPDARTCMTCGGEGYVFCEGDEPMCPDADDSGCYMHHAITCWNCRGTGAAKDQWFW